MKEPRYPEDFKGWRPLYPMHSNRCARVYIAKWCANVCCADHKDRQWLKSGMRPFHDAIGRLVDGEFTRFKKVEMKS